MLFAPWPAESTVSVQVLPYFAAEPEGEERFWRADTLTLKGPEQVPYPHNLRHRTARQMCR